MRRFSSTDLANKTGDVLAAAAQGPVTIDRHGKARFVMLSTDQYEFLTRGRDTRQALHASDLDAEQAKSLVTALQESIDDD